MSSMSGCSSSGVAVISPGSRITKVRPLWPCRGMQKLVSAGKDAKTQHTAG